MLPLRQTAPYPTIVALAQEAMKRHHRAMGDMLLDAQYQKSPLPVLRAARALRLMPPGARLRVLATAPDSVAEFHAFCADHGHALLSWSENKGVFSFTIRRNS